MLHYNILKNNHFLSNKFFAIHPKVRIFRIFKKIKNDFVCPSQSGNSRYFKCSHIYRSAIIFCAEWYQLFVDGIINKSCRLQYLMILSCAKQRQNVRYMATWRRHGNVVYVWTSYKRRGNELEISWSLRWCKIHIYVVKFFQRLVLLICPR